MQRQHSVQATAVTSPIVLDGFAGEREKQLDLLRTTVLAFRRARNAGLALDPGALLQVMEVLLPRPMDVGNAQHACSETIDDRLHQHGSPTPPGGAPAMMGLPMIMSLMYAMGGPAGKDQLVATLNKLHACAGEGSACHPVLVAYLEFLRLQGWEVKTRKTAGGDGVLRSLVRLHSADKKPAGHHRVRSAPRTQPIAAVTA